MCDSPIKMIIDNAKIARNNCNCVCTFYTWKFLCTNKNALIAPHALLFICCPSHIA